VLVSITVVLEILQMKEDGELQQMSSRYALVTELKPEAQKRNYKVIRCHGERA
jgi:hypothetical protein